MKRLSVQSRLVLLLLLVSLSSILAVGIVAYASATEALTTRTITRLENLRKARSDRLIERIDLLRNQVVTLSETGSVVEAMREFRQAYQKLTKVELPVPQVEKLRNYYEKEFLPRLSSNIDGEPLLETYLPHRNASRYLQYHYLATNPHALGEREKLDTAADGSEYSAVHQKYHPYFRRYMARFGFRDILLINPDSGDILYTCEKSTELGRSLYTGPFAQSNLANLVRSLRKQSDRKTFRIADFETYIPSMGRPAAFVASPIFDGPDRIGILVMQFPVDSINKLMSGNSGYRRDGLGQSGEVYIVGSDHLLRTSNRAANTDLDGYLQMLRKSGYSPATLRRIKNDGTPILQQMIKTPPVEKALLGQDGIEDYQDYLGEQCLASYGPLEIEGLHWVIVAKISKAEAYGSAYELGRRILITLVVVALIVSVLAVILARLYVRPIQQIRDGVRALAEGKRDVNVKLDTQDEYRELADSFNDMSKALLTRSDLLDQQRRENEELLVTILPAPAILRVREGNLTAVDTYPEVTILLAHLVNIEGLNANIPEPDHVRVVDDLVDAFDDVAEQFGIEKLRTHELSYLAVCGLSVARVDHPNRCLDFAIEILRVLTRFNKERGTAIGLKIGIHTGPVVGSLVGRRKFAFELWGNTITQTQRLASMAEVGTILISRTVQDKLRDLVDFTRVPEIQTQEPRGGEKRSTRAA
ncbi:MAG: adenylate/guanylate cyclase domain-containing protein [Gemmataceae bacterium]